MEEFIEKLYGFIASYGVEIVLMAAVAIMLVGIMKLAFKKKLEQVNPTGRKALYEILSVTFTLLTTTIWLTIKTYALHWTATMDLESTLKIAATVNIVVKVMYPIYENYGLRKLLQIVLSAISKKKEVKAEEEKGDNTPTPTVL